MNNNFSLVEDLPEGTKELFGATFAQIEFFAQLLVEEGELRGLIGPREIPRLWSRHLINSTAVEPFFAKNKTVADLGSGAGFPGVVLAIMRPDLEVSLIETMERRCDWLADVVDAIGLDNVRILQGRVEDMVGHEKFDYVTSRAVAAVKKIVPWSMPLIKANGALVALKGEKVLQEIEEAKIVLKKFNCKSSKVEIVLRPGSEIPARVLIIRK